SGFGVRVAAARGAPGPSASRTQPLWCSVYFLRMLDRLRARKEWKFAAVLPRADGPLATAWWTILVLRGLLPALFAVAMGWLVGAVQGHGDPGPPLAVVGGAFVLLQVLPPIHHAVGTNLGSRTAAWLYDRLTDACVRPPGMGHLENPSL